MAFVVSVFQKSPIDLDTLVHRLQHAKMPTYQTPSHASIHPPLNTTSTTYCQVYREREIKR